MVADGSTVMFGQWNTATVKGHKVAYPQIARNVLGDEGRTIQARRYYERHVLVRDTLPNAPKGLFDGIADHGKAPARGPARAAVTAGGLPDRLGGVEHREHRRAAAPGGRGRAGRARTGRAPGDQGGQAGVPEAPLGRADLNLKAGQVAFGTSTTYVEWHGTVTRKQEAGSRKQEAGSRKQEAGSRKQDAEGGEENPAVPFGIVERFGPDGQWELYFDTLPVLTDQTTINNLLAQLATP
ncbi:hypothetical protein [Streptomyces sp. M54]|uniref:hypothetical protein n=1 Tax=Streptomyces sp. M54 TaxID=2759525 RepID=UPI001A8CEF56|nr:hypothetical protein [Streptomyces sp. M54]QSS91314.1 hypothetical protein H3V39_13345 [Streptomyces sp. M54]